MEKLTGAQRKHLRGLAHGLKPLVQVGRGGVTEGLIGSLNQALEDHELVKVKFQEFKEWKKELAASLAARTGSEWVGLVGNIAVFYREHPDPEKRRVILPP